MNYPDVPVGALLAGAARRYGTRTAFRHRGTDLSFADLDDRARRFAYALRAKGVGRGDVVSLRMPNCLRFPVAYYGILLAGAAVAPSHPKLPMEALDAQVADCGAVLVVDDVTEGSPVELPDVDPDDLAQILYTGGTTGRAKGVEITHRAVVTNTFQWAHQVYGALPQPDGTTDAELGVDTVINVTPWFHVFGTIYALNLAVLTGVTTIIHDGVDPELFLADVDRFGVTSIMGAPPLFAVLSAHPDFATRDLSSVRSLVSGGAVLSADLAERLRHRFPDASLTETYGLTEALGVTAGGVPLADTEVKLVDGEICVRSPQMMRRYLNQPEETAQVLVDGWLHTGDIGVLDEEDRLSIVDRKKDVLIYLGLNVYPRELEELLLAQPGVLAAAVVGRPDPEVGDLPVAFVVTDAPFTEDDLLDAVNPKVAPYKRLTEIRFVDHIPVSPAGKILKRELVAWMT